MNVKNISRSHVRQLVCALAIASVPLTSISAAQLEEIVVTAQKRSESLQDVPISVVALSGDELASLNRSEVSDLAKSIAGFTFQTGSGDSEKAIQIRGVGTSTFSKGVEQSVGTVIDGVVASGLVASFLDFSDVARVEVLRGPQGMLFGKNASSGLLNITTQGPTEEFSYGFSASYADENEQKYNAYVSGALTDTVMGRLSLYSSTRDGYIDNINTAVSGEYNNKDEWGGSAKLLIEPSDELSIQLNFSHSERDYDCCFRPPVTVVGPFAGLLPTGEENDTIFEIGTSSPNIADVDVASIQVNYELGENTLTSISSYTDSLTISEVLATGLPLDLLNANRSENKTEQITQELRITSPADQTISYVAGLYYYDNELNRNQLQVFNPPFSQQPTTAGTENFSTVTNESMAIFGQATWNISDTARFSAGLRYNDDEVSLDQTVNTLIGGVALPPPFSGSRVTTVSETNLQWRVIAELDVADAAMLYGTVARGYKGPGANTVNTGLTAAKPIVDPEIPTNYEVGLKSEWFDGSLRLNASAFLTQFEDFQASLSDNKIPPKFFLANAGELETKGLELEVTWQASDNLLISGNLAYIDASFKEFTGAECYPFQTEAEGCIVTPLLDLLGAPVLDGNGNPIVGKEQDLSGADLPFSPDLTVNLFARYDIAFDDLPFGSYVQGSYHWQDEAQLNSTNDPLTINESYGTADFALGFVSNEGAYEIQVFVKNAFDTFYRSGYTTQGNPFGVLLAQSLEYDYTRRVGIKFKMDF